MLLSTEQVLIFSFFLEYVLQYDGLKVAKGKADRRKYSLRNGGVGRLQRRLKDEGDLGVKVEGGKGGGGGGRT